MKPTDIDKGAFLLGFETGRRLRSQQGAKTLPMFKQVHLPDNYEVSYGNNSVTLRWVRGSVSDNGVVLVPGLSQVTITGSVDRAGAMLQYGTCNQYGVLPNIIASGKNRLTFENGEPVDEVLTIADPTNTDCFFIGDVFSAEPGDVVVVQISWGGAPPPMFAMVAEDNDVMLTEDNQIMNVY